MNHQPADIIALLAIPASVVVLGIGVKIILDARCARRAKGRRTHIRKAE